MLMASVVLLGVFALSVRTLALGLPWGDAGEPIAAARGLGLGHPPGGPLSLLLAKLATFVPAGSIAFRVSLLSALAAAGPRPPAKLSRSAGFGWPASCTSQLHFPA